jgi:hypothetical protein
MADRAMVHQYLKQIERAAWLWISLYPEATNATPQVTLSL